MKYVLIIHEVEDYTAWKKVFDNAAGIRKEAGEISYQVLKYEHNANKIVHFSIWSSHAHAKQFFESPKLVEIRKQAGVKAPDFIYLDELESGVL
jgi:quinol monooxygenase YgiN